VRKYRTHTLGAFGASSVELVAGTTLTSTAKSANTVAQYERLLRYIDVHVGDDGMLQIQDGLAGYGYDSTDGCPHHPRPSEYVAADLANPERC